MYFPRFFFLSNDDLLAILSSAKDIHAVQPHLRKCFDNLVHLDIQTTGLDMGKAKNKEGDTTAEAASTTEKAGIATATAGAVAAAQ